MDMAQGMSQMKWEQTVRKVDGSLHAVLAAQARQGSPKPHFWSRGARDLKGQSDSVEARQALQGSRG